MKWEGIIFTFLLIYSSSFGCIFFLTPLIPFVYFQPRLGRWLMDQMIWLWQLYAVFLYEKICGVKAVITGDVVYDDECELIIMNHRTRFDWLFVFSYQIRCGSLRHFKISLKEILKNVPGPGWAMQCAGYLFLHRNWEHDKSTISKCFMYFKKLNYKPQILLFPEGTDLTPWTKAKSDKFAQDNGVEPYEYVLHPRTRGFKYFVEQMRDVNLFDSIIDVTVGYPVNIPQNESDILKGNFPKEVHFYIKRHKALDIPSSEENVDIWCQKVWKEKEERLKKFYQDKKFDVKDNKIKLKDESEIQSLFKFANIFWSIFQISTFILLIYAPIIRWFALLSISIFVFISKFGGIQVLLDCELENAKHYM
ncbi:lysocardiolipin acyltransferase 1-like [Mytilus californianus]|uniref:lysocardiolipin acyltransferase 1-like n=1 Tax=Mytilus californianus TaxID=6549 RepID=UPI0022465E8C|nr:lysocardiolipin acyltransferase 1-like [Mytilus californianus]